LKKPKRPSKKILGKPYEGNLTEEQQADEFLWPDLEHNIAVLKGRLGGSPDIIFHEFLMGLDEINGCVIYTDGLIDRIILTQDILNPLPR